MGPEVSYRINQQNGALSTLKKHVFRNPNIESNTKVEYAKALCSSRLLYNSEIWCGLTVAQRDRLDNAHSLPFRYAT
eukprot:4692380-Pyramimonas_sp.AAC.1